MDQNASSSYNDKNYLSFIEKYKNESWYDRLLENPWMSSKQADFSPNLLQQIGEALGDTSARDAYYGNLMQNQNQWLSDTLAQYHQQDYDSALEQSKRLQAAGINPDLNGGVTPGTAAENDQPLSNVPMPSDSAIGTFGSAAQTILGVAFQFVSGYQSVRSSILDNSLKSLSLNRGLGDAATDIVKSGVTEFFNSLDDLPDSVESLTKDGKFYDSVLSSFERKVDRLPYSLSQKRKIKRIISEMMFTSDDDGVRSLNVAYEKLLNDSLTALHDSRKNFTRSYGEFGASFSSQKVMRFISSKVIKPINDTLIDIMSYEGKNKLSYTKKAYELDLGSHQAFADNANALLKGDILNVRKSITSSFQRINNAIIRSSGLPPMWKLALQAGLSSAESIVFSKLAIQ